MDGLSAAASIIAVIQITGKVIAYLHDVKDAPKECRKHVVEISESYVLLSKLNLRISESNPDDPYN